MPPFSFNYLALIDFINCPELLVTFIQENALENVVLELNGCYFSVMIYAELVLVVRAIKGHLDLSGVPGVRLREIHRSESTRFIARASLLALCKSYLLFLRPRTRLCAEFCIEGRLVMSLEVLAVGMSNCNVVVESSSSYNTQVSALVSTRI